jgi:hypothetical protein
MGVARCVCCCRCMGRAGGVGPMVGLGVGWRAFGTQVRVFVPPGCGAAEGCDALVSTGVVPAGVWR